MVEVLVKFPPGVLPEVRGTAMLAMEQRLWSLGVEAEVVQETRPDDSKLRSLMTVEERDRL